MFARGRFSNSSSLLLCCFSIKKKRLSSSFLYRLDFTLYWLLCSARAVGSEEHRLMNSNSSRFLRMINNRHAAYMNNVRNAVPPRKAVSSFKYSPSRPETWGPVLWDTMHVIAAAYPHEPTAEDKQRYSDYYNSIQYILPCETCKEHFQNIMKRFPLTDTNLASRRALSEYILYLRNEVNEAIGRPRMYTYKKLATLVNQSSEDDVVEDEEAPEAPEAPTSQARSLNVKQAPLKPPIATRNAVGHGSLSFIKNLQMQSVARQNVSRQIRIAAQSSINSRRAAVRRFSSSTTSAAAEATAASATRDVTMVDFNGAQLPSDTQQQQQKQRAVVQKNSSTSTTAAAKNTTKKKGGCGCNKRKKMT